MHLTTSDYLELPFSELLDRISADGLAPGAGSAAALTVAFAARLVGMVARCSAAWEDAPGVSDGDLVRVCSPRGVIEGPARLSGIRRGHVFVPFHYGYWDRDDGSSPRAANELTLTAWDPVSKQPLFKVAAVRVERVG